MDPEWLVSDMTLNHLVLETFDRRFTYNPTWIVADSLSLPLSECSILTFDGFPGVHSTIESPKVALATPKSPQFPPMTTTEQSIYTSCPFYGSTEPGQTVEESTKDSGFNNTTASGTAFHELKLPTALDWANWKSTIVAEYKNNTARLILERLKSEGFYVTEKMLRARFKHWSIKKNVRSSLLSNHVIGSDRVENDAGTMTGILSISPLQRPVATSAKDIKQRQFLNTMDHYLEQPWESKLVPWDGYRLVNIIYDLDDASRLAAGIYSQFAWSILKECIVQLQTIDLSRISPTNIIQCMSILVHWEGKPTNNGQGIQKAVSKCLSRALGAHHPVSLMIECAASNSLNLEICQAFLAIADRKTVANASNSVVKQYMDEVSKEALMKFLWWFSELQVMEEVLNSWSTTNAEKQYRKAYRLANAKTIQGKSNEAVSLYSTALITFQDKDDPNLLLNIVGRYVITLLNQGRAEDAVGTFLNGLSRYDEVSKGTPFNVDRELGSKCTRTTVRILRWRYRHADELDRVIEKLNAMLIDL